MKRAVVTGGAGFIGSNLCKELISRGYDVTILDDLSTGKKSNIESILDKKAAQFVEGSIMDVPLLQKLFHNSDFVFHLAAIPSVSRSIENPLGTHNINVNGTLNVLIAANSSHVKKVIYASSSSVYGDTPTLPKVEVMTPDPQSPYAVSKLAGEYYCRVFSKVYNLPTACLRYFNVFGPYQDEKSQYAAVIPRFISKVLSGNAPIIFGDGEQTRDFTFVKDAVAANVLAAESDASGVFNIGTGYRISINELARVINKLAGANLAPIHEKPRIGDIRDSLADIKKASTFGFRPTHHIEEGIKETIAWFKSR